MFSGFYNIQLYPTDLTKSTPVMCWKGLGQMIGVDFVLNEFVAFVQLGAALAGGAEMQARSLVIAIYALTTFANFGSVAMTIAGIGEIAPSRRPDLARLGLKAMLAGLLASLVTAAVAGMLL